MQSTKPSNLMTLLFIFIFLNCQSSQKPAPPDHECDCTENSQINRSNYKGKDGTNILETDTAYLTKNSEDNTYHEGALWNQTPVDLNSGFTMCAEVSYDFQGCHQYGLAFVLHNNESSSSQETLGTGCDLSLGFSGLEQSIAVVMQTSPVQEFFISDNQLERLSTGHPVLPMSESSDDWKHLTVTLDGTMLNATLEGAAPIEYDLGDLNTIFSHGYGEITWGFTATTGGFPANLSVIGVRNIKFCEL